VVRRSVMMSLKKFGAVLLAVPTLGAVVVGGAFVMSVSAGGSGFVWRLVAVWVWSVQACSES
jgi:hypothetical protein